jgi:peptide alpha-N-acetyltransferase
LRSGKPSLFSELKSLYARDHAHALVHPDKVNRIEQQFEGYLTSLRDHRKFDVSDTHEESPSTLAFTLHFAAQHFDSRGDYQRALLLIEEAIAHTPTLINLYVAKARIHKHAGSYREAAAQMEVARKLDLADRYLNTVSTKYQLRADQKEQAEATVGLFTKWDAAGQSNLYEMQASWYELELAAAYRRAGDLPNAITQYGNVVKHFHDFDEDQLDFHAYCIRKLTLRAYLDMLRWEDNVHSHRFYYRAATNLVECYLAWLGQQERACEQSNRAAKGPVDESEEAKAKRKEESKKRRADAKSRAAQQQQQHIPDDDSNSATKEEKPSPSATVDLSKVDCVAEATKLVRILEKSNADKLHTHVLAVQVYMRAGNYSAALAALKKAKEQQPDHPDVHRSFVRFFHHTANSAETAHIAEASALLGEQTLEQANDAFLAKHSGSLPHLLSGAEMKVLLGGAQKKSEAASLLRAEATTTLRDAEKTYRVLLNEFGEADAAGAFQRQAHQQFPLASAFAPPSNPVQADAVVVDSENQ